MVRAQKGAGRGGDVALQIVDYKTGKAPTLKYSPAMNQQIVQEAFFQLKIYALLWRHTKAAKKTRDKYSKMPMRWLRLFYLTSEAGNAKTLDMDLGATEEERDAHLQQVHQDLSNVWTDLSELVALQDPKAFVGCDRSFCYCHSCRGKFLPGTLWEPSPEP